ncbi:MAG: transketolase [Bdellovibrionales bacterium]|nr:transketolase [Bdellovibrionales bacterium]
MIQPISMKTLLAPTPTQPPKYSVTVKNTQGEEVVLADPKATRALVALMDMAAVIGGAASHWGGPSAFAELMAAAHGAMFLDSQAQAKPWTDLYHFVNDAGHCENGLYALKAIYNYADLTIEKLKGFRSIDSVLTGHGESHLFPQGVYLSNGPLGSSLPQAQGLAMADAWAGIKRVTVAAISDGACMEGEAKEALSAIPGFAAKGKLAPFILIISDNNTKLSGRIDSDSYSMNPTFKSLTALGWNVLSLDHAHDLEACYKTFEKARHLVLNQPQQPVAIHAKTIKGYGVQKTAESSSGGHGFPLKKAEELSAFLQEIYGDEKIPQEFIRWIGELVELENKKKSSGSSGQKTEKIQVGVASALIRKKQEGLPIVSISSDLPGSTGVADFQKKFPESSQDIGVAESNMISVAAGLSKQGFIPIVDTFSQFGVTKGALPMTMASLSEAPVIAIFSHAGFQDAADGASHQALTYFSMTSSIPHVDVYCLTTSEEADALVGQAVDTFYRKRKNGEVPHTSIFFLGRENFVPTILSENIQYQMGRAQIVFDTSEEKENAVTIVAAGSLIHQAIAAARTLKDGGQGAIVVNPSIINRPDVETLQTCLEKTGGRLVTVEDHQLKGGMGALLLQELVCNEVPVKVRCLGVKEQFGQSAYNAIELYRKHGLDARAIVKAAQSLVD